jgi:hypothetical protein
MDRINRTYRIFETKEISVLILALPALLHRVNPVNPVYSFFPK